MEQSNTIVTLFFAVTACCCIAAQDSQRSDPDAFVTFGEAPRGQPDGYYAFEEGSSQYKRPPKVRKPPYMQSSLPCPTGSEDSKKISPKYTFCGDLNKGFIPRNPMGQSFDGEPYPFELLRNKTLRFLSKTLPFLKADHNVPKVARFVGAPLSYREPGGYDLHQVALQHRLRRSSLDSALLPDLSLQSAGDSRESYPTTEGGVSSLDSNATTARQNCDQAGGILCSLSSAMSNSKLPLAMINAVAQGLAAISPTSTSTTTPRPPHNEDDSGVSVTDAVLKLIATVANTGFQGSGIKISENDVTEATAEPSSLGHVLSILTGASGSSPSALSMILKLMASEASPLKALILPTRRRRPVADEIATDTNPRRPNDGDTELPPTPCPSVEEYVTPTFARNYQGVWKYVVQIPQEGYFTQTVQQTKCVRSRCDFMDGVCHESPRWVSLLVAETFYPDTFFPTSTPPSLSSMAHVPPVEDFYNFQQYLKRRVGVAEDDDSNNYRYEKEKKSYKSQQNCDGQDHIGCYIVRLYYDWFLVNGSCKCWKPSAKRVLSGK